MLSFFLYLPFPVIFLVTALILWRTSDMTVTKDFGYGITSTSNTNGFIAAVSSAVFGTILLIPLPIVAVSRYYAEASCNRKDEVSSSEYRWLDYHYFSYECMLVTPSGNITDTPILPLEDMSTDR